MPKLNQIVAVVTGKKTRSEKEYGELNKQLQKSELFSGLTRTYTPTEENGETLPSEQKLPQKSVADVIGEVRTLLVSAMDAVATQEYGNVSAFGDVIVGGTVILKQVPVTVLLYLEKQLNDLHTFTNNLPTLDPAIQWTYVKEQGRYESAAIESIRTKKVQRPLVLSPATDKFPAQTQLITEDVTAGKWSQRFFSTAISVTEKKEILKRITALQDAVKEAREQANSIDVAQVKIAEPVLDYVFGH